MSKQILILNGPNLNLLGQRQPDLYGHETLDDVITNCREVAKEFNISITAKQSNHEGALVEMIHEARGSMNSIIINAGAYSHTSIAVLDALNMFDGPVIEVHISNIYQRESFRHKSYITSRADGIIVGCGVQGYELAVLRAAQLLS